MCCLDCGFLALHGSETSEANRVLLHVYVASAGRCSAGLPKLDQLWCHKSLWTAYELTYVGFASEGMLPELDADRRLCRGFMTCRHGLSPKDHLAEESKRADRRTQLRAGLIGGVVGAGLSWLPRLF